MSRIIDDDKVERLLTLTMSMQMPLNTKYMIIPIDNFVQNIIHNATVGEVVRCKDCRYFLYDKLYMVEGLPLMGNLVCEKWGNGCRTDENGYCFMGERREDAETS